MLGQLIPAGLLSSLNPWPLNLVANSVTVHFIHRWLAFAVLILAGLLYYWLMKKDCSPTLQRSGQGLMALIGLQIMFGISVILWQVPPFLAVVHQNFTLLLLMLTLFIIHRLWGSGLSDSR